MKFLVSLHINQAVLDGLTEAEQAALGDGVTAFMTAVKESGELVAAQALAAPAEAKVVSVRGGRTVVTDGPFTEAKEFLGGYYLLECASPERAVELAARIPDAAIEGLGVEVRQVVFSDDQLG